MKAGEIWDHSSGSRWRIRKLNRDNGNGTWSVSMEVLEIDGEEVKRGDYGFVEYEDYAWIGEGKSGWSQVREINEIPEGVWS